MTKKKRTKTQNDSGQGSLFGATETPKKSPRKRKKTTADASPGEAPEEKTARKKRAANAPKHETAESMAARQRDISVSEFFSKNRHLLGFDSPRKALLTAIKEAVDNSLDACEEAGILPDLLVEIVDKGENRYVIAVQDNGPGIVRKQVPNIFGKLLYGSKFHRLKMSRGQQGIGISAAGMYGMLTTGRPVRIVSRPGARRPAHHFEIIIDTKKNKPEIVRDEEIDWESKHGTRVEIELEGRYAGGRQSVDEYLRQTAIANPHVQVVYRRPNGEEIVYERSSKVLPPETKEIKPHPHGIELGLMQAMLKSTKARNLAGFLQTEFSRVSAKVAEEICANAELRPASSPARIGRGDVEHLMKGINATKIMNPPTGCVAPIGEEQLLAGLRSVVPAQFYTSTTRPPAVYRGNPFIIEAALAWGGKRESEQSEDGGSDEKSAGVYDSPARLLRFANRVPLLYQQGACCAFGSTAEVNWRAYALQQPRGALPVGPLTVVVHMASVWVPFTSESKEAIASYPEIEEQMMRALQECGRKLKLFLSRRRREADAERKRSYIETYIPHIGIGLRDLIGLNEKQEAQIVTTLTGLLERAKE